MKLLNKQIFENREAAALPYLRESGGLPALISGLSAIHRAHLAAALFESGQSPLVVICPDESAADSFARDIEAMTDVPPLTLLPREFCFMNTLAASHQAEQQRISALDAIWRGDRPITVTTVSALMQRTMPPTLLESAAFEIRDGGEYPPDELEKKLLRCGYTRTEQVEGPGQFARRGGIMDFYSPMHADPVRIEFWGDSVDSMGFFDVHTQRRTEALGVCRILPAAEALPELTPGGAEALADELSAMAERASKRKGSEQLRLLTETLRRDADLLRGGTLLRDADRYLPFLYEAAYGIDYLPADATLVLDQPPRCADRARGFIKQLNDDVSPLIKKGELGTTAESFRLSWEELCSRLGDYPVYMADAFTVGRYPVPPKTVVSLPAKQLPSYAGSLRTAADDVSLYLKQGYRVVVLAGDKRRAEVLRNFFADEGIRSYFAEEPQSLPDFGHCLISVGAMSAGMDYPGLKLCILSDAQILRVKTRSDKRRKKAASAAERINSYADLSVGDLVVHEVHGIGRFAGIQRMKVDGFEKDYIKICYAGTDTLYVPATQLDMVTKYLGTGEDTKVKLSKMGGTEWAKTRSRARAATKKLAKELITLYAERARLPGHAFSPDTPWQREFEDNFGYTETDDQLRCIEEIKADMESSVPMDRLLCGDVGYGKTEVALRAVMKCIMDNKQAAILVPTTVLAQ